MTCKCVHKSLRNLIQTPEFAKSYTSAPPCLAVFQEEKKRPYEVCELDDKHCCVNQVFNFSFSFPRPTPLHSSVDGLLLLFNQFSEYVACHNLIICNPIARDYIKIPSPRFNNMPEGLPWLSSTGFGVSKTTSQYKVVRVFCMHNFQEWRLQNGSYCCQVYTLGGGGLWRSSALTTCSSLECDGDTIGVFLNGNIHWLAFDSDGFLRISCFDLETELFTTALSPPPLLKDRHDLKRFCTLSSALSDCLVLCDNKDGDVLINGGNSSILCYSNKTRSIRETDLIESRGHFITGAVCFTPSFLPLKTLFPMENVSSF